MIKLLFVGDRHNSQNIPKCRKDDFVQTCEDKDNEIIQLAIDSDVDVIVHPGDFWTDSDHKLKNDFIAEVAKKWDNVYSKGRKIPLIGIAGNHDLIGENEASLSTTTTGLLDSLGIFPLVSMENPYVIKKDGKEVVLTGVNYHKGMDKPENISDYIVPEHLGDVHIHIVHGMLSPTNLGKLIRHTRIDSIRDTKADITYCGHDHSGFGIVEDSGKYFINPGAVVRLSADKKELARTVGVVLVTIDSDIKCEFIPLKTAQPSSLVIDRTELDKAAALDDFTEKLKDSVKSLDIGKGFTLSDIVDEICSEKKIDEAVKKSIKTAIEANVSSKTGGPPPPKGTNIVKMHMVNFQSHADTTLEFDKHFNVIVGESRQGKSSVLRALRWVMENKPSGNGFIRTGESSASVELTLENGTIIKRFIGKKENGYKIFLPDGKVEEGNTKMVGRVQELMGYSLFKIDEKTSIPLNILRQGDSWYLIGEKYTGVDRARILGALKDTNAADMAIKDFDHENNQIQSQIRKDEIELANSKLELEKEQDALAEKQKFLQVIDAGIAVKKAEEYETAFSAYKESKELSDKIAQQFDEPDITGKISRLNELCKKLLAIRKYRALSDDAAKMIYDKRAVLSALPDVDALSKKIQQIRELLESRKKILSLVQNVEVQTSISREIGKKLDKLNKVNDKKLSEARVFLERYIRIKDAYLMQRKAQKKKAFAERFISGSAIVDHFTQKKQEALALAAKVEQMKATVKKNERLKREKQEKEASFRKADSDMGSAIDKKISVFSKSHVCPVCLSHLSDEKLDELVPKLKKES